jgi:phosphonate transport system substrate-binding protein
MLPMSSFGAMIDAQEQRRIDGGFYSAAAFALAQARCQCLEPIASPRAEDGTDAYHGVIVARRDSGITAVADLKGRTVAVGPLDSIGARRMQLAGLMAEDVDPASHFGAVLTVESAEEAIRLLLAGAADAAFAWSSLAGAEVSGYSRGTLAEMTGAGALSMDEVAVVWRSPAIPHGPFAVLATLADADKEKIGAYLVALERSKPAAYDILNPFYAGGYALADQADYAGLEVLATEDVDALDLPEAPALTGSAARPEEAPAE